MHLRTMEEAEYHFCCVNRQMIGNEARWAFCTSNNCMKHMKSSKSPSAITKVVSLSAVSLESGASLYARRVAAMVVKRAACARRDRLAVVTQLAVPIALVLAALWTGKAYVDMPNEPPISISRYVDYPHTFSSLLLACIYTYVGTLVGPGHEALPFKVSFQVCTIKRSYRSS